MSGPKSHKAVADRPALEIDHLRDAFMAAYQEWLYDLSEQSDWQENPVVDSTGERLFRFFAEEIAREQT